MRNRGKATKPFAWCRSSAGAAAIIVGLIAGTLLPISADTPPTIQTKVNTTVPFAASRPTPSDSNISISTPYFKPPAGYIFVDPPEGDGHYLTVDNQTPDGIDAAIDPGSTTQAGTATVYYNPADQAQADTYRMGVRGLLATGGAGGGGNGGPITWAAKETKVTILAAPAYIMADSDLWVPIYFQVGDVHGDHYKDNIEIESAALTVKLNGTATPNSPYDIPYFGAGDYVTNGARAEDGSDQQVWRRAKYPDLKGDDGNNETNNTRADYSAFINPDFFHGIDANGTNPADGHKSHVTTDVTVQLTVSFKIDGKGDSFTATSNVVTLHQFADDHIAAVPFGYYDPKQNKNFYNDKSIQMCRPDGGTPQDDTYGFKERTYQAAQPLYQKESDATGTISPQSASPVAQQASGALTAVFTPSRDTPDANTVVLNAKGDDTAPSTVYYEYDGTTNANFNLGNSYLGGMTDEKIGADCVSYYGYRDGFWAFTGGNTALNNHPDPDKKSCRLLDVRINTCDMTPYLFPNADGTNGYVFLWVGGSATDTTASALSLGAAGFGLVAAICEFPEGAAWEAFSLSADMIASSGEAWDAVAPKDTDPCDASATFATFWQTQVDGTNKTVNPNSATNYQSIASDAATASKAYPCWIQDETGLIATRTTWVGWVELGTKVDIRLGNYGTNPNKPSSFAKFWYDGGFQGTDTAAMFKVHVSNFNDVNPNTVADVVEYEPTGMLH